MIANFEGSSWTPKNLKLALLDPIRGTGHTPPGLKSEHAVGFLRLVFKFPLLTWASGVAIGHLSIVPAGEENALGSTERPEDPLI